MPPCSQRVPQFIKFLEEKEAPRWRRKGKNSIANVCSSKGLPKATLQSTQADSPFQLHAQALLVVFSPTRNKLMPLFRSQIPVWIHINSPLPHWICLDSLNEFGHFSLFFFSFQVNMPISFYCKLECGGSGVTLGRESKPGV